MLYGSVTPIIRLWSLEFFDCGAVKKGYNMAVESVHSKVHVQLATHCLNNTAHVHNESQKVCEYSNVMSYL